MPSADELLEHLEASLGPLKGSESVPESALSAQDLPAISILAFGRDAAGFSAYATFGLSRHLLDAADRKIAQEIVIPMADGDFAFGALTALAGHVLESHRALSPGERHRLQGWSELSPISGVIVVPDPEVRPFTRADPRVEFARLFPITDAEAAFAREHGWHALGARLAAPGVNVTDLLRPSVV